MKFLRQAIGSIFLIAVITVTGIYAVRVVTPCRRVLAYDIGQFDTRFGISKDAFIQSLVAAEKPWEHAFEREFFVYKPGATFKVNLIYDYRQEESNQSQILSDAIESNLSSYNELKDRYESLTGQYTARLAAYNTQVAKWNASGGAPEAEFTKLEKERIALNSMAQQINALAKRLNSLSESTNQKVDTYNASAGKVFDKGEFTQSGVTKSISIYEFKSTDEMELTLTHELGHALGAGHVSNELSVMYPVLQKQDARNITLTSEDTAELSKVCRL